MTSIRSLIDWVTGRSEEELKIPVVEPVIVGPTSTEPETRQDMKEDESPLSIILSLSPILCFRSSNLARAGIKTIPDLNRFNRMSDSDLLAIKGIGRSTLGDIRHFGSPPVLHALRGTASSRRDAAVALSRTCRSLPGSGSPHPNGRPIRSR